MLKALQLIFEPATTWESISGANRKVWQVVVLYLLPTILIALAVEAWGLHKLGNQPSMIEFAERPAAAVDDSVIIRFQASQAVLLVVSMFLLSALLQVLLKSMHSRAGYPAVFTAIAYSFAPYFLMIAIDALPFINTWICRGIGAVLVAKVFYVGLVRVIKPEPTTALGAYLTATFLIFAFVALTHFVALQVLEHGLFKQPFG